MNDNSRISLMIYNTLVSIKNTLSLPTHATLEKTFIYSLILFGCSILSTLLKFYTFISWQGCLICIIALFTLLWIERSENDALLRMYRTVRVSAEKTLQRTKTAGSGSRSTRSAGVHGNYTKTSGKRKQRKS